MRRVYVQRVDRGLDGLIGPIWSVKRRAALRRASGSIACRSCHSRSHCMYLQKKDLHQHQNRNHLEAIRTVPQRCEAQLSLSCSLHSGFSPEASWRDTGYARRERCGQDRLCLILTAVRICRKWPFRSIVSLVSLVDRDVAGISAAISLDYCRYSFCISGLVVGPSAHQTGLIRLY